MIVDLQATATQSTFAAIAGVSQPVISGLVTRGVLAEGDTLGRWIIAYYSHLREIAAGRIAAHDAGLTAARTAHSRAAAEKLELQNAVTRRELVPARLVEEVLAKASAQVAGIFDAIPGLVQRRVPDLPFAALDLLRAEISRVRNIVGAMSLADLYPDLGPGAEASEDDPETEELGDGSGLDASETPVEGGG